jgi:hypothetical protein
MIGRYDGSWVNSAGDTLDIKWNANSFHYRYDSIAQGNKTHGILDEENMRATLRGYFLRQSMIAKRCRVKYVELCRYCLSWYTRVTLEDDRASFDVAINFRDSYENYDAMFEYVRSQVKAIDGYNTDVLVTYTDDYVCMSLTDLAKTRDVVQLLHDHEYAEELAYILDED